MENACLTLAGTILDAERCFMAAMAANALSEREVTVSSCAFSSGPELAGGKEKPRPEERRVSLSVSRASSQGSGLALVTTRQELESIKTQRDMRVVVRDVMLASIFVYTVVLPILFGSAAATEEPADLLANASELLNATAAAPDVEAV